MNSIGEVVERADDHTQMSSKSSIVIDLVLFGLIFAGSHYAIWQYELHPKIKEFLPLISWFVGVLIIMKLNRQSILSLGLWRPLRLWTQPFWIILIGLAAILVAGTTQYVFAQLVEANPDYSKFAELEGNFPLLLWALTSAWVTAAFMEEVIFRGFLLGRLLDLFCQGRGVVIAVFVQALIFGLIHSYQGVAGVAMTFALALIFGFFFILQKRNLWALILSHGLIDTASLTQVYLQGVPSV